MASAADASSQRRGRPVDWIERIGGVISGRAVATLALNANKVRGCALTHKPGRQLIPNRMARQTTGFLVRMDILERLKGAHMRRILYFIMNFPVALRAGCSTGVLP